MSTLFSVVSCGCPRKRYTLLRSGVNAERSRVGTSKVGAPPRGSAQARTAPWFSTTCQVRADTRGGLVPYPVATQAPSVPKRKPWKGQRSVSPSTVPPWPRWAPRWGQIGSTAAIPPLLVRKITSSRPISRLVVTLPAGKSADRPMQYQPLGNGGSRASLAIGPDGTREGPDGRIGKKSDHGEAGRGIGG
jgi:hypothetical protein